MEEKNGISLVDEFCLKQPNKVWAPKL